jgi:hypothetical protein
LHSQIEIDFLPIDHLLVLLLQVLRLDFLKLGLLTLGDADEPLHHPDGSAAAIVLALAPPCDLSYAGATSSLQHR